MAEAYLGLTGEDLGARFNQQHPNLVIQVAKRSERHESARHTSVSDLPTKRFIILNAACTSTLQAG